MRGELPPGTPLQQEAVARRLGLSSTPVREAFVVLESEGLVEKRAHQGVVVAQRNASELIDVYEMRRTLEIESFRRAIPNIDDSLIAELERLAEEADRALPDIHECRRLNARFHDLLLSAARSPIHTEVLRLLFQRSLFAVPLDRSSIKAMLGHHHAITRALRRRDYARAEEVMAEHLAEMIAMLRFAVGAAKPARPRPTPKVAGVATSRN
jgi:DNA-binding GntR family transcriptional regulator